MKTKVKVFKFYFSAKQEGVSREIAKENGKKYFQPFFKGKPYTEAREVKTNKEPVGGKWDDYIYVGLGKIKDVTYGK